MFFFFATADAAVPDSFNGTELEFSFTLVSSALLLSSSCGCLALLSFDGAAFFGFFAFAGIFASFDVLALTFSGESEPTCWPASAAAVGEAEFCLFSSASVFDVFASDGFDDGDLVAVFRGDDLTWPVCSPCSFSMVLSSTSMRFPTSTLDRSSNGRLFWCSADAL